MKLIPYSIYGWPEPVMLPESKLVKRQTRKLEGKMRKDIRVTPTVRWDDSCGNGHNSFSVTADLAEFRSGVWHDFGGGCCHEDIIKSHPEIAHLIRWHLVSANGPMHYLCNVIYQAGDRDCRGLRKDEKRQLKNGRTGTLCWNLVPVNEEGKEIPKIPSNMVEAASIYDLPPPPKMAWLPHWIVGEGKEREFAHARSNAVWPEATDEQLSLPKAELSKLLMDRLPSLMQEFYKDVTEFGFIY